MDTNNHTVTIPYDDYVAMKTAYTNQRYLEENRLEHERLLSELNDFKIVFNIDLSKKPRSLSVGNYNNDPRAVLFKFDY